MKIQELKNKQTFYSIFNSVKSPVSRKENVQFLDSPDFESFLDFLTGRDIR